MYTSEVQERTYLEERYYSVNHCIGKIPQRVKSEKNSGGNTEEHWHYRVWGERQSHANDRAGVAREVGPAPSECDVTQTKGGEHSKSDQCFQMLQSWPDFLNDGQGLIHNQASARISHLILLNCQFQPVCIVYGSLNTSCISPSHTFAQSFALSGPHLPTPKLSSFVKCHPELFLLKSLPNLAPTQQSELTTLSYRPPLFCELGSNSSSVIVYFCFHVYFLYKSELLEGTGFPIYLYNTNTRHRIWHKIRSPDILLNEKEWMEDFVHQHHPENKPLEVKKIKIWLIEGSSFLGFS